MTDHPHVRRLRNNRARLADARGAVGVALEGLRDQDTALKAEKTDGPLSEEQHATIDARRENVADETAELMRLLEVYDDAIDAIDTGL